MNVLILGAGASKSYEDSSTNVKMPIAKDFFDTFHNLRIAEDRWVLIGDIVNYLNRFHSIPALGFLDYSQDIEILHSEVEGKLKRILENKEDVFSSLDNLLIYKTYMQLMYVFSSVINEIQNGPVSTPHLNLAKNLTNDDCVITFNWDTLMDRALGASLDWKVDNGYFVQPSKIYRNSWMPIQDNLKKSPIILKLHGSTNWLTSVLKPDIDKLKSVQETPTDDFYIYESTVKPYATYKGRYMNGYQDFSYGYYPPNLPLQGEKIPDGYLLLQSTMTTEDMPPGTSSSEGLYSMPLIIPPVKHKNYLHFGKLFSQLWDKAEDSLARGQRIIIIGYSFPITDIQTNELFRKAFLRRTDMPEIVIVDPAPANIVDKFKFDFGITDDKIKVYETYFSKDFDTEILFS